MTEPSSTFCVTIACHSDVDFHDSLGDHDLILKSHGCPKGEVKSLLLVLVLSVLRSGGFEID